MDKSLTLAIHCDAGSAAARDGYVNGAFVRVVQPFQTIPRLPDGAQHFAIPLNIEAK